MGVKSKSRKNDLLPSGELIVQHNKLIEARYSLSLQEKKVILDFISASKRGIVNPLYFGRFWLDPQAPERRLL